MERLSLVEKHIQTPKEVVIVAAGRSPLGAFRGNLSELNATDLAAQTLSGTLAKYKVPPQAIEMLYLGNVYSANLGQSPAKQVAVKAGLPPSTVCVNMNKVCSSGMVALTTGYMDILLGNCDTVAVGGVDVMSAVPLYQYKGSQAKPTDGMIKDGLWDAKYNVHMGECAERCADKYGVSKQRMDEFSQKTIEKAHSAWEAGKFQREIVPVVKQDGNSVAKDQLKPANQNFSKMRTVFRKQGGRVTAGNASPLSDGAAMLVLTTRSKAQEMGWSVLGKLENFAHAEQDNVEFTTSPNLAVRKLLEKTQVNINQVDLFELNEAFAVVGIVNTDLLGVDPQKVNVYGGAIALGHPLGCSGARIVVTLLSALRQENKKLGVAGICNGGGGGSAVLVSF